LQTLGITPAGKLPGFVATTVLVESLAHLRATLDAGQVPHREVTLGEKGAVAVTLPEAVGDAIIFREW
jgi:hypothetical protein